MSSKSSVSHLQAFLPPKARAAGWLSLLLFAALGSACGNSLGRGPAADARADAIAPDAPAADPTDAAADLATSTDSADAPSPVLDNPDTDSPDTDSLVVDNPDTDIPAVDDAAIAVVENPDASVPVIDNPDADLPGDADDPDTAGPVTDALAVVDSAYCPDATADARRDTPTVSVVPVVTGTVYTFTFDDTVFAVDAALGGRIVTFSLGGRNMLTAAKNSDDNNWGSTLWPSPQSDWNWPPPAEIDSTPYTALVAGGTLTLSSATSSSLGLSAAKTFSVDPAAGVVTIAYQLTNRGAKARSVAPWEISRVAAGGLTFFPMGAGSPGKGSPDLLALKMAGGAAWFSYDAKSIPSDQKVLSDGHEGWIAHVDGNLLLVKSFADISPAEAAPGEAEIEIFTDAAHTYIELENQGALANLGPNATLSWTVRWLLRQLDPSISVEVGSLDLQSAVRALVRG